MPPLTEPSTNPPTPPNLPKKSWFRRHPILTTILAIPVLAIGSCAFLTRDRTVTWEEDVLLNTGETIVVSKRVRYVVKGAAGNPMDLGYRSELEETLSFKYGGREYSYTGDARIMVLAISPDGQPTLLANASYFDWDRRNDYKCTKPFYVMFQPNATGKNWIWPDRIKTWTYELPTNLLGNRDHPNAVKRRYTLVDKKKQAYMQDESLIDSQKINPIYVHNGCIPGVKP